MRGLGLLAIVACLAGCASPTLDLAFPDIEGDQLEFESVAAGSYSGYSKKVLEFVVNDERALTTFWKDHTRHERPASSTPKVEWSERFVVVAIHGERPTGGHSVRIDAIVYGNETYGVLLTRHHPGSDCGVPQAESNAFEIVSVPRQDGGNPAVRFRGLESTRSCS